MARDDKPGQRTKRGRGAIAAAVVVLLAAGGGGAAYYLVPGAGDEEAAAQEEQRATPVVVEPVVRGTALDTVATVGEVRARNGITVTSEVSGRVVEIPAGDGSFVDEGDVIVRFDDERERAELRAAEARANEARLQFERTQELAGRNVVAEAQLDERRAALRTAEAEASQARTALEKRTIRAPFPGRLGFITVDPGAVVEPGSAIAQLTSPPPVRLRFRLASRYLDGLDVGDRVEGSTAAFPGQRFAGEVVTIDPAVDQSSRNVTAEAELADDEARLRPGLFLDATVVLRERDGAMLVPEAALQYEGPVTYVFRVDGESRARRAPVEIGSRRDGRAEIVRGLELGDRVVVEGVQKIADGALVEPQERSTASRGGTS